MSETDPLGWLSDEVGEGSEGDDWLGINDGLDEDLKDRFAVEVMLRELTNKIHTCSLDDIFLGLSGDLQGLFAAERVSIYGVDRIRREIFTKVRSGEETQEIRVPLNSRSLAGFVASSLKTLRVTDAYDDGELKAIDEGLSFDVSWDQQSGFRTREVLAVPVLGQRRRIEGVIQLVNNKHGRGFSTRQEKALLEVAETLSIAFNNQRQLRIRRSPYDGLFAQDLVNEEMIDQATAEARKEGDSIEQLLVTRFKVPKAAVLASLSEYYGVPPVELSERRAVDEGLLERFTVDFLKHHHCAPLGVEDGKVLLAMDNPKDIVLRDALRQRFDKPVAIRVAVREDIIDYLDVLYPKVVEGSGRASKDKLSALLKDMDFDDAMPEAEEVEEGPEVKENSSGIMQVANQIIENAYRMGVSDIHVEPYVDGDIVVRYRIDGVCQEFSRIPKKYARALSSRLKIMSGLDIAERRLPQDGKIKFKKYGPLDIELRVATLPTVGGMEDCVMRILAASKPMPLDAMGFTKENFEGFRDAISQPYGLVLVVGPTGSGKTTTLHSGLGYINKPETKIWTAEDPVEITQEGLRQVQMHPKIGLDFARALRAFLRADPDVIMIGEMRDQETAEAGVEASLTGHLVFSTLHTNSAPETVTRLLDMGLDPYSFGDSLLGVLAQRLMRRLCKECKQPVEPEPGELDALRQEFDNDPAWERLGLAEGVALHRAVGCDVCGGSGYKGRMGIHEFMAGSDGIRSIVYRHGKVAEIREQALTEGMTTLKQDGIRKVLAGHTDVKEVRRVCIQ